MKITCLIDNLASGGAQRQMCSLAILLKQRGHKVSFVTYYPEDFFSPLLNSHDISIECYPEKSPIKRLKLFMKVLNSRDHDVVLSFLETPNVIAEISSLSGGKWGLVVSERNTYINGPLRIFRWKHVLHAFSDFIVTNSHTNRLLLEKKSPWLVKKLVTIYNTVDYQRFAPSIRSDPNHELKLLIVARFSKQKNISGFLKAFKLVVDTIKTEYSIRVDWYGDNYYGKAGKPNEKSQFYDEGLALIKELNLEKYVHFYPPVENIAEIYKTASALILPSYYEGLPNVVCEAMACGLPILMSDNCDSGNLVRENENGFLFNPFSVEDMAKKILLFCELSFEEQAQMGKASRRIAEEIFDEGEFVSRYEHILSLAAEKKTERIEHWIPDVPWTAYKTLNIKNPDFDNSKFKESDE